VNDAVVVVGVVVAASSRSNQKSTTLPDLHDTDTNSGGVDPRNPKAVRPNFRRSWHCTYEHGTVVYRWIVLWISGVGIHGSSLVSSSVRHGWVHPTSCGMVWDYGVQTIVRNIVTEGTCQLCLVLGYVGCLALSADCISIIMHQLESAKQPITTDSTMVHRDSSTRSRGASTLRVVFHRLFQWKNVPWKFKTRGLQQRTI
jgi:hypothetical protein